MQVLAARGGAASVVDFGCGEGGWIKSVLLEGGLPPPAHLAGVDVSPTGLSRGRKLMALTLVQRQASAQAAVPLPSVRLFQVRPAVSVNKKENKLMALTLVQRQASAQAAVPLPSVRLFQVRSAHHAFGSPYIP